jgi:hypothetical protein
VENFEPKTNSTNCQEFSKTWSELAEDKIKAREALNKLPLEIAIAKVDVLQAMLGKPDIINHNPLGSFWDFEDE